MNIYVRLRGSGLRMEGGLRYYEKNEKAKLRLYSLAFTILRIDQWNDRYRCASSSGVNSMLKRRSQMSLKKITSTMAVSTQETG